MRAIIAGILCIGLSLPAAAQTPDVARMFLPGPAAMVLQVGRWLSEERDQVYVVTVQGQGRTPTEAREQAFRLAVQQAAGALVLRVTEVDRREGEVRRNDMLNYSSGYVDRFETLQQGTDIQGRITVDMRIWVRRSRLAEGLFGRSEATDQLQGEQAAATIQSLRQERTDRRAMLGALLKDYPQGAFHVVIKRTVWNLDQWGDSNLTVTMSVEWHNPWITSMSEAVRAMNGAASDHPCYITPASCYRYNMSYLAVFLRPGAHGRKEVAAWSDAAQLNHLKTVFTGGGLSLRVELLDAQERVLRRDCLNPAHMRGDSVDEYFSLVSQGHSGIEIYAYVQATGSYLVRRIPDHLVSRVTRIQLSVQRRSDCPLT